MGSGAEISISWHIADIF